MAWPGGFRDVADFEREATAIEAEVLGLFEGLVTGRADAERLHQQLQLLR